MNLDSIGIGLGLTSPGGGGAPTAFQLLARSLRSTLLAASPIADMASPPTVSASGQYANSSLQTGNTWDNSQYKPGNAVFTAINCLQVDNGTGHNAFISASALGSVAAIADGGQGWGVSFKLVNGDRFDFGYSCPGDSGGLAGSLRMKVNGQWVPVYTSDGTYNFRLIKYVFGAIADYNIELYFPYNTAWTGVNLAAGASLAAWSPAGPKYLSFGDSYVGNIQYQGATAGIPHALAALLGTTHVLMSGRGGQGAVKASSVDGHTLLDRSTVGDFARMGAVDCVLLYNSVNDWDQTAATVQANWQTIIARAMTDQPNALILGWTGFSAPNVVVDSAHNAAFLAAFNAVKAAKRMAVWDGSAESPAYGYDPTDNIAADNIHASVPAGVNYYANRIVTDISAALLALS